MIWIISIYTFFAIVNMFMLLVTQKKHLENIPKSACIGVCFLSILFTIFCGFAVISDIMKSRETVNLIRDHGIIDNLDNHEKIWKLLNSSDLGDNIVGIELVKQQCKNHLPVLVISFAGNAYLTKKYFVKCAPRVGYVLKKEFR